MGYYEGMLGGRSHEGIRRKGLLLRWVLLLVLVLWTGYRQELTIEIAGIFILAIAWGLVLANERYRMPGWFCLIGDSLIATSLFFFSGTLMGNLVWAALLPIACAAIIYRLPGGLLSAVGASVLFGGMALIDLPSQEMLRSIWRPSILLILTGMGLGFWSQSISIWAAQNLAITESKDIEMARSERERKEAQIDISAAMNGAMSIDQVLNVALDLGERLLKGAPKMTGELISAVLLFHDDGLHVAAARRFSLHDLEIVFPTDNGLLAAAMKDGKAQISEAPHEDAELRQISVMERRKSALVAPIRSDNEVFGFLLFAHSQENFFNEEETEILITITEQLAVALQNSQIDLDSSGDGSDIAIFEMNSRRRIARGLHDGAAQSIAAIAMKVNLARKLSGKDADEMSSELAKIEELARRTAVEIRHMLFTLKPEILEIEGVAGALSELAKQSKERFPLDIHLDLDPKSASRMDIGKQSMLFNIAVEALDNARRHAKAKKVWIRLKRVDDAIVLLEVEDDGVGFDERSKDQANIGQSGLDNIRERAEILKGRVKIENNKGKGSLIRVWVPEDEKAVSRLRQGGVDLK